MNTLARISSIVLTVIVAATSSARAAKATVSEADPLLAVSTKPSKVSPKLEKPDFAYPKDVIATAKAFLASSAPGDTVSQGKRVLALSEIIVAECSIDKKNIFDSIELGLDMADKARKAGEPDLAAMLYAYTAGTACEASSFVPWGREAKAVRPDDMSEWAASDFDNFADSIYGVAIDLATPSCRLERFDAALKIDRIGYSLTPTVRDFIVLCASSRYSSDFIKRVSSKIPAESALAYYLKAQTLSEKKLSKMCLDLKGAPGSEFAVKRYLDIINSREPDTEIYATLLKLAEYYPNSRITPDIETALYNQKRTMIYLGTREDIVPDKPHLLTIQANNIDTLRVTAYGWKDATKVSNVRNSRYFSNADIVRHLEIPVKAGVEQKTVTDSITLPAGNYLFVYKSDKKRSRNREVSQVFEVNPWRAFTYSTDETNAVVVVDAITGAPVSGISVEVEYYSRNKHHTIVRSTDSEGVAYFNKGTRGQVSLRDRSRGLFFKDCCYLSNYNIGRPTYDSIRATISTDRSIYRPGDTVRWTAVFTTDTATATGVTGKMSVKFPVPQDSSSDNVKQDTTFTTGPSDKYGRIEGSFVIPTDVATGRASLKFNDRRYGYTAFNISEFKLRDLSIDDTFVKFSSDSIFITGRTVNSARVGVSDIDVKLSFNHQDSIKPLNTHSGSDGKFGFTLDRKAFQKKTDSTEDIEIADEYGRSSSHESRYVTFIFDASAPDGRSYQTAEVVPVGVDCSVSVSAKPIYDTSKGLDFKISGTCYTKDDKRDEFNVAWALYKDPEDSPIKVIEGNAVTGDINIAPELLKDIIAGEYRIAAYATDCKSDTTHRTVTLYNSTRPETPDNEIVWMPTNHAKIEYGATKVPLTIGIANDNTRLTWITYDKKSRKAVLESKTLNRGYHTVEFDVPQFHVKDLYDNTIPIWVIKNGSTVSAQINFEYAPDEDDRLSLECESFRDNTIPGGTEHWTLITRRGQNPVSAAVTVNIYNTQLDQFGVTPSLRLFRIKHDLAWNSTGHYRSWYFSMRYTQDLHYQSRLILPAWLYTIDYNYEAIAVAYGTARKARVTNNFAGAVMYDSATEEVYAEAESAPMEKMSAGTIRSTSSAKFEEAPMMNDEIDTSDDLTSLDALNSMPLRTNTALNALWAPTLTTDSTGRVDISVSIPDQTSKWRMTATAWTKDLNTAYLEKTFVATKPIIVAPNLPRFVRVGDTVNLVSAITNDTDSAQSVTYTMEAAGHNATGNVVIEPHSTYYVTTTVPVTGSTALNDSLVVTMRASNGAFGDGERRALPILTSSALVTESRNFYLNPGDTVYNATLPKSAGEDFETELHFTNNPMWTVVESLPSVIEPAFDVAPSLAMSLYASLSAIDIATEHPAARSVIDIDKARKSRSEVFKKLNELRADGGFRWGKWSNRPDVYTTLCVLDWLEQDIDKPDIKRLTDEALRYVDRNIATESTKITPDLTYTLVRSAYGRPSTVRGQQVFDVTTNYILGNWKKFSLNEKSVAALILYRTGNHATAKTIMSSVVQFGTVTADRGLIFHNMPSITAYATMLTAMNTIMPDSPHIDSVRQALLYLRQGMKWSTSAYTSYAVRAISTGSTWVVNRTADDVRVTVDGNAVAIDSVAAHNGAINLDINGTDAQIERTPGTPAYGSIVTRYVAPLTDIRAFSDGEISVEKHIYAIDDNNRRIDIKNVKLHPGERLLVSFTIKAARPLTGVILNDMRPAAFEPVEQISKYQYAGELGYFLENRDSATNIYLYFVPRGTYIIEYPVTVNNTGTFTTGVATITSTVDPDITAHSSSTPLVITDTTAK